MRRLISIAAMLIASSAASASAAPPSIDACLSSSEQGQVARDHNELVRARDLFLTCRDEVCPQVVKSQCEKWSAEVENLVPTVVFAARDANDTELYDVQVSTRGRALSRWLEGTPVALDPGPHDLVFTSVGRRVEQRVVLRPGEKNRVVSVRFGEPARPARETEPVQSPSRVPLILAGVGALGLASFTWIGLGANADLAALESSPCAAQKRCLQSEVDSVETRFLVADVSLIVGVVALGAATIVWLAR